MFNFGGGTTGGGFGAPSTNTAGGFGSGTTGGTGFSFGSGGTTGGGFGATQPNTGGFGSTGTTQNTGFSFGAQPATNTGGFGGMNNTTSAFGQNKPFGTTGATTTGFSFGGNTQTQQQPQQQGNTFGASGNPFGATGATNTGFGAPSTNTFGSTGTTQTSGFSFGSQPTGGTTAGGFGAGTTNPFGTTGTTTGGFGNTQPTTGTGFSFGSQPTTGTTGGGSLFGTQPTQNTGMGFGGNNTGMGMGNTGGPITPQSFPSFKPTEENNTSTNTKMIYYSITKMDPYKDKSFEEWRWYFTLASQGKLTQNPFSTPTTGTTTTGGFGQTQQPSSSFSFGNTGTTNTGFGNTGTMGGSSNTGFSFGGNQPTTQTGFGTANTGFGTTTNTGAFGTANTTAFGQNKPATTTTGFSFGSQPTTGTTGGLGFGSGQPTTTTGFAFGSNNTGTTNTTAGFGSAQPTSGFNFGGGSTTLAPLGGTTNTGNTGSGFNFGSAQPTTGTANTGSGFNFGGSTQPSTSSGFNFGTGTSGFGGGTTTGGLGTTTTAPTSGFNFGGGNLGATGATTAGSGFNFGGTTNTGTAGSSGFNFGTSTQPLGGTTSGFNFGTTGGAGLGLTTGFGGQPTNVAYGVAPMALPDLNNLLADPFGSNPLFQLQKEALEQSYAQEEESSVISKSIQKTSTQVRPRTFKKSSNNTLVDRMSLIATDTESATLDLLDSNSFTSKENVKELTISSAVFDKRSSQQLNQPRSNGTTSERDESQKTISSNTIRPKPQKGKAISLDIEQSPKETTVKPNFLPKLTREGYYTKPSFEEMKKMSQQDLQNCNGFTVGRKGYGEVEFLGVTDLTRNLDLDKIIYEIETNHVEVYSSNVYTEKTKPSVGTELNKPTIVKLFNVHSKNNDIKLFERKLRKANERSGSKFIDYVNGQWTFKVEHFTKYGIFDDEEDEEEIIENEEEEKQEPFQVVKSINLDEISDSSEDEIIEEEEIIDNEDEDDVMQIESHRTFLPRQLNLDPRRMYIMQANLMADDEAADDNNINFEAIRQTKKPRFKEIAESEPTLAFVKKDAPVQPIKPRKYIDSTPSNIVGDPEAESTHRDSLFSLSRSFRVGFLPNGQLIVPSIVFNPKSRVSNISVSEFFVKEDKKVPQTQESEYLKLKYESKVHLEIEHSERDPNDLHISLNNNSYTKLMEGHVQKCEKIINSVDHFNFSDATKQLIVNREKFELSAWKLVHLLFGEVEMLDGNDYATDIARKRNLSSWIREQIPIEEIINRVNPKPLEKIYLLLSSGRIAEAARVALENKDVRLSSIISQSFSNPFMQKDIQKQINLWKQAKANIDKDLIKIYELLAGNVCDTSLTWLQCLGLHLWYKNSPDTTISQVFASYTNYFETSRSTKPFLSSSRYSSETHYDLRYHVLGMYCKKEIPISSSLEPSTYVDDILDCQLTWHLYNVLRRVTSCDTTGSMSHIINCNYALQLEQAGYPQYALFVLCHSDLTPNISDDINRELNQDKSNSLVSKFKRERLVDVRNRAIREILFRNYPILMTNESGMKFIKELQISPNWIYEAAALYARYTCSYQLLFENLCHYHNYVEAHKVFLEYILSDLLLCNKYEELTKYIQKLYDHQVLIPNWSKGGDILYRYICVRKQFETLEAHIEGNSTIFTDSSNIKTTYDALSKLDVEITELLDLVKHLTLYTLEHRVAVSDTTVKITNMMVKVKSLLTVYEADTDYNEMIQEDSNQKEQCLFNVASVTQNVYLTNQIDLLQTLALSTTFNLQ